MFAAVLAFVKSGKGMAWIAGGLALSAFLYFGYVQAKSMLLTWNQMNINLGEFRQKEQENKRQIDGLQLLLKSKDEELIEAQDALRRNSAKLAEITEKYDDTYQTLQEHQLNTLMVRKPGLMEGVYNRGTAEYYRLREESRRAPYEHYIDEQRSMSPTIRTTTPSTRENSSSGMDSSGGNR